MVEFNRLYDVEITSVAEASGPRLIRIAGQVHIVDGRAGFGEDKFYQMACALSDGAFIIKYLKNSSLFEVRTERFSANKIVRFIEEMEKRRKQFWDLVADVKRAYKVKSVIDKYDLDPERKEGE